MQWGQSCRRCAGRRGRCGRRPAARARRRRPAGCSGRAVDAQPEPSGMRSLPSAQPRAAARGATSASLRRDRGAHIYRGLDNGHPANQDAHHFGGRGDGSPPMTGVERDAQGDGVPCVDAVRRPPAGGSARPLRTLSGIGDASQPQVWPTHPQPCGCQPLPAGVHDRTGTAQVTSVPGTPRVSEAQEEQEARRRGTCKPMRPPRSCTRS